MSKIILSIIALLCLMQLAFSQSNILPPDFHNQNHKNELLCSHEIVCKTLNIDESNFELMSIYSFNKVSDLNISPGDNNDNKAIEFNGSDTYLNCGNDPNLDIIGSITFEAWIYPYYWDGNNRILQKGMDDNQYRFLAEWGDFRMHLRGLNDDLIICNLPTTNEWHHMVGVYDHIKSYTALYIDGKLMAKKENINGRINITDDPLCIGTKRVGAPEVDFFNGLIDEVRIWKIARTAKEIHQNMYRELTGCEYGLAGYWNFNQIDNSLFKDYSSNNNDGEVFGNIIFPVNSTNLFPKWLSFTNFPKITSPANEHLIKLYFNCLSLYEGEYQSSLIITLENPVNQELDIPVFLTVIDSRNLKSSTIADFKKDNNLNLFPNPTSGIISITGLPQPSTIKIYNLQGKLLKSFQQVINTIDLSDLNKGVYILNLQVGGKRVVRKIVKE